MTTFFQNCLTNIDMTKPTPLCLIMGRNKSNKGNLNIIKSHHNYTIFYYHTFINLKKDKIRIFELGLENMNPNSKPGASLYAWADFFPNSKIFGADIDKNILFKTDRIETFFCDKTDKTSIQVLWNKPSLEEHFDIIIDNGIHNFNANVCFFENSIHKLKVNGFYIIENIHVDQKKNFENKLIDWRKKYTNCYFEMTKIPSTVNFLDNNLLIIWRAAI